MNIYDISAEAGVSIATVSRVLNGSGKVSDATRRKVLDVIEKNRFMPNAFARSLGLNSMSTVGILCSDSSDVYQAQAIYYLERELRIRSYASMLCCTGHEYNERLNYLQLLLSRNVDALFFIGSHFVEASDEENRYIIEAARKIPVFILNGELAGANIYSVLCDDFSAVKDMTDLLFRKGSRRPILLYRVLNYSGQKKMQGFLKSCRDHGADSRDNLVFSCTGSIEEACRTLEDVRKSGVFFDAVAAADDELAAGAVKYAIRSQLRVPDDFQVTGYNNSVLSVCSTPEITTLDNRVEFMCTTAVSHMLRVFQSLDTPSHTIFSGNIVKRQTTR